MATPDLHVTPAPSVEQETDETPDQESPLTPWMPTPEVATDASTDGDVASTPAPTMATPDLHVTPAPSVEQETDETPDQESPLTPLDAHPGGRHRCVHGR
ncbi:unnamed protein product [Hyaloperonospora brassicae]|uniref:RxLR effector candidate protein n=1 Tax=Hyaloperonospora brassicae TaxID=162125 RepID=A0AAV0UPM1_HYABA|nr:unnamed protein product [Hyaloperonospora brassicae]